jgi:hypothetical protein
VLCCMCRLNFVCLTGLLDGTTFGVKILCVQPERYVCSWDVMWLLERYLCI